MPTYPHVTLACFDCKQVGSVPASDSVIWSPSHVTRCSSWSVTDLTLTIADPRPCPGPWPEHSVFGSNWWGPEGCSLIWLGVKPRLAGLGQWLRLCHLGPLDQPEAGPGLRVWSGGSSCLAPQGRSFMTVLPQSHSSDKSQESFHCQLAWESYSNCQCPDGATKSDLNFILSLFTPF